MSANGTFRSWRDTRLTSAEGGQSGHRAGAQRKPWDRIGHPLENEHPCRNLGGGRRPLKLTGSLTLLNSC
jgi:hypothetical protein